MLKIVDTFKIGANLSVTFEGACEAIKNGSKLKDSDGKMYNVLSVGMTRHNNPNDISKNTTVLMSPCELKKGEVLYIA